MPAKLTYGASLMLVGSLMNPAQAQFENGEYYIGLAGKIDGEPMLSTKNNCGDQSVMLYAKDRADASQKWKLTKQGSGYYMESVGSRSLCGRKVVSVPEACWASYIDLWVPGDVSGRTIWNFEDIGNGLYAIKVSGGRNCREMYMGGNIAAKNVNLIGKGDGLLGFNITPVNPPAPIAFPSVVQISSLGKTDGLIELTADNNCADNQAFLDQNMEFRREHGWRAVPVPGKANTFNLINNRNCDRKFLSVPEPCGWTNVDLWTRDDGTGRQQWTFSKVAGQDGAYTVSVGGRACPNSHLSTRDVWDRVDLWNSNSDNNQWFKVEAFNPYTPLKTNLEGDNIIRSLGKTDNLTFLGQNRQCNPNTWLAATNDEMHSKFRFTLVPGKQSVYYIQNLSGCDRAYLSANNNCSTYVDYWFRAESLNQQWLVQPVADKPGAFVLRHLGKDTGCNNAWMSTRDVWNQIDLWNTNIDNNQWFEIEPFAQAAPLTLPVLAQISSLGKTDNLIELSADRNCNEQQAFLDQHVEFKREHGWRLQPVAGKVNTFNIISHRNCERKHLSVGGDCGQTYVDLWTQDDNSGRQQWEVKRVAGKENTYTLTVGGRSTCPRIHLSTRDVWDRVDLWLERDNDNQWFNIETYDPYLPEPTNFQGFYTLKSLGKTDGKEFSAQNRNCALDQQLVSRKKEQISKYQFRPVQGRQSVYTIQSTSGCERSYLSYPDNCSFFIDYWFRDDGNGNQHWLIQPVPGKQGAYTLRAIGKPSECNRVFMSTAEVMNYVDLYWNENKQQHWGIEVYQEDKPIEVPSCAWIKSLAKADAHNQLMYSEYQCNNGQFLKTPGLLNDGFFGDWQFVPVEGKTNTFNIIAKNSPCDRKFLSVGQGCGWNYIDLWNRDDGSGRQQWTIHRVEGKENAYMFQVGGRDCPRVYMSNGYNMGFTDLYFMDDHRQHYSIEQCVAPDNSEVDVPSCARVLASSKTDGAPFLSASNNCNEHSVFTSAEATLDKEQFADWRFVPVEGQLNTFNIIISDKRGKDQNNCNRKFLSVGAGCGQTYVDLWTHDDGSGRQQWTVKKVPGTEDKFSFEVGGRRQCDRVFLSSRVTWDRIELWDSRYEQQQFFTIEKGSCRAVDAAPIDLKSCNTVVSLGKTDDLTNMVASTKDCNNVAWLADPKEIAVNDVNTEKWTFQPVAGKVNTFNLIANGRECPRKFLSVGAGCGQTYVDLWTHDDASGRQQWTLEKVEGKQHTYALRVGGRGLCPRNYLSTRAQWDRVDLWREAESDRQYFEIKTCKAPKVETNVVPECGRIISTGKVDGRTNLAFRENNCDNWSHLVTPNSVTFQETFRFVPVEGKANTYNIVSRRNGCPRNFLSVGAGCGQNYIDLWHRDDNSGRQQWRIERAGEGFTLVVGGRARCDRVMLSTRANWWRPDLWKENDNSGRQVWKLAACAANEPAPRDNEATFWWRNPLYNTWNWGPNWQQPAWNWRPNQGAHWRLWWRNNRQWNWRRNFAAIEWNRSTQFRFWLRFVRDNEYVRPINFALNAQFKLDAEPGSNQVFRGGEGFAFDWIQMNGNKGFGLIKVVNQDWYLSPIKVNGKIRHGARVAISDQLDWTCIWFWNGRRLRHFTGRWLRVSDDGELLIQNTLAGDKSLWQMVGPDESALENFPGVPFISEDQLFDEDFEEDDEKLPEDTVQDENPEEPKPAPKPAPEPEDDDIDIDDDLDNKLLGGDDDDEKEKEKDEEDVDFSKIDITDEDDVEKVDQEDGEELDNAKLPFEEGKVKPVQPDSEGKIPAGNCCNPVSRAKEAVAFNKQSASAFVASYNQVVSTGNTFIYTYIAEAFKNYPDAMNPIKVFNLGTKAPQDNTMNPIINHFSRSLAQTDAEVEGAFNSGVAKRVFRRTVANLEGQLEVIDFAVEMMRVANDDKLKDFEKNQGIVRANVRNFYRKALQPHRFAYKVFSRVPISQGTVSTLSENMIDKLHAFRVNLRAMNKLGLTFRANKQMTIIARNARRLNSNGRYQRLRTILRQSRRIMVLINRETIQKDLHKNVQFLGLYESASNNLFRANDSRSVRCLGIWALKRRTIHVLPFENLILNGEMSSRWTTQSVGELKAVIAVLKAGQSGHAVDHLGPQRAHLTTYIDSVFKVTREIAAINWRQHQHREEVGPSAGAFYRNYYTSMGNWRYALKNVAF